MKRFFRTAIGKAVLFIIFTLMFAIIAASIFEIWITLSESYYVKSEEDLVEERISSISFDYVRSYFYSDGRVYNPQCVELSLYGKDGNEIASTDGVKDVMHNPAVKEYSYSYAVVRSEGNVIDVYRLFPDYTITQDEQFEYENYSLKAYYIPGTEISGLTRESFFILHYIYSFRFAVYPILLVALVLAVLSFVGLMSVSGRHPDTEEVVPGPLMKVPFDVMLAVYICLVICAINSVFEFWGSFYNYYSEVIPYVLVVGIILFELFLGLCMSFATRVKLHCLIKGTLIYMVLRLIWRIIRGFFRLIAKAFRKIGRFFRMFPVVWRTIIILTVLAIAEFLVIVFCWYEPDNLLIWWFFEKIILYPLIIWGAFSLRKLQNAGAAMAKGDLTYKTDVQRLYGGFRSHAENLNSISSAMSIAVEDRIRSERMKTELITNVSHDIKTPLTSIINYASLIGAEKTDNQNIAEYSSVLVNQSEKLKRLIEDLVEASKASSGAIDIVLEPCDAGMFISQASGEYEDKIGAAGLTLVTKQPENEVRIMADTRRMWRVFDNLMNNVCKYSQYGTRVYLSLEEIGRKAVITLKNTSREPLNISADELMERFVRGDSSRNTDGNGLGLSIAKSLTELQGGEFSLDVDGDLFKITLRFSII